MKESKFQSDLKKEIKENLPDAIIRKMTNSQGFPDLLILNGKNWAMLECKRSKDAHHQPNQDNYISKLNEMSFASFIFPENKEEVLNEVYKTLRA